VSIVFVKKQAKRLSRLLPEHLKTQENPSSLSACQELMARVHGYASFHAAVTSKSTSASNGTQTMDMSESVEGIWQKRSEQASILTTNLDRNNPFLDENGECKFPQGDISYTDENGNTCNGKYWLVDIGPCSHMEHIFNLGRGGAPMTALVFDPLDEQATRSLLQDERLRDVAQAVRRDISTKAQSHKDPYYKLIADATPEMFILMVHDFSDMALSSEYKGNGLNNYALCFTWAAMHDFNSRVVIESKYFTPMHQQLRTLTGFKAFERFVIRECYVKVIGRYLSDSDRSVTPRANPKEFEDAMNFVLKSGSFNEMQLGLSVKIEFDEKGWLAIGHGQSQYPPTVHG
jgi:hypothetical protein